ncbi:hypothetical protein SAMN06297280_1664 [Arsukibacterium tuosuense]|uniref:DUF2066 domain-containing protein n=1 Tax=Arsukibacterium tuosuense TaxID=1323745 RepID=A0A285IRY9_9GAMM|nr:DUF2066 domain-containing protein [Arsukibacterium tuosuense]SNY50758.1 hypothetical protein SAMN06297280_1664 [Arsukibacterium tuosuense]
MVPQMQPFKLLLATLLILFSNLVAAIEVDNLYVADVSAEQNQRQWQSNALAQVITRLTGISELSDYPDITSELASAGKYVKQFESFRQNGSNRLKVLLDASLINVLLQQQGIAIWGSHRPEILLWVVQQQGSERFFLRQPDNELVKLLLQSLSENGIPVTLPLYDIDDLMLLSETDVWAGFWQPIKQASQRYRPDMIMTLAFDEVSQDGTSQLRLSWQRQSPVSGTNQSRIIRNEVTAADNTALISAFSAALTRELAAEQAVLLNSEHSTYQLAVENLQSLADVVAVERLLNRVLGVAAVTLSEFSENEARFAVDLQIELAQLTRILRWEPALTLSDDTSGNRTVTAIDERFEPAVELSPESPADVRYMFIRR